MATGQLDPTEFAQSSFCLTGVPVLLYHGITRSEQIEAPARERKYWIGLPRFQDQLAEVRQSGREVRLLREFWNDSVVLDRSVPPVVLTFDDGQVCDYEIAFPALLEAEVRADFFVNTHSVGRHGYLDWRQITEMHQAGMAFHSHSHDHIALSQLPDRELGRQLLDSKRLLEDRLGRAVEFLAPPYGLLNRRVVGMARSAGYRAVCNSWSWPARPGARTVSRVAIYRHTTLGGFRRLLVGDPLCYLARAVRHISLHVPKRMILRSRPAILGVRVLLEEK